MYLCAIIQYADVLMENAIHGTPAYCVLFFVAVNYQPFVAVGDLPGGIEHQLRSARQQGVIDLFNGIGYTVVIFVRTVKVENYRDVVPRKHIVI